LTVYKDINSNSRYMTFRRIAALCLFTAMVPFVSISYATTEPAKEADPIAMTPPENMVPENLVVWPEGPNQSKYAFVADKSRRTLTVWRNDNGVAKFVEAHPMDIGKRDGVKEKLGDHKTPEGIYFPVETFEGSNLNFDEYGVKAFVLDYPNYFDKRDKKTGSGIWLHAIPDSKSLLRGSRGCVVVRNDIIKKLSPFITLHKTPVIILDKVTFVSVDSIQQSSKKFLSWLDTWRTDWSTKQIDKYMNHYAEDFLSLNMSKKLWKSYKQNLNQKYQFIDVKALQPVVIAHKGHAIVRFFQEYKSDALTDFGQKTLFVVFNEQGIQIRGEEWAPVSGELLAHLKQ
jgi:murein L,D-transpeptidase YafK